MGLTAKESGKILYIELDNLNQGNSFGLEEAKDLETIYRQWKNCPLSGIIFSSVSERFFCAGGNLEGGGASSGNSPQKTSGYCTLPVVMITHTHNLKHMHSQ